ncbi:hypothetical protein AB205_0206160 [Aquarana catesbeiana]|uniref:Uncharacterized protein n=1 Tax=Aquarana catesbeiana TaxID=8400 RepID=A0A2G9RBJ8_AQUCT|nr:hypothetical protein AB205_0206160 [Aquarana catesbeiana]
MLGCFPRSLDRMDSMDILSPPKFSSWEEDYNQLTESVTEESSICQDNEPRCILQYQTDESDDQRERYQLCQVTEEQRDRYPLCQVPEEPMERYTLSQVPEEPCERFQLCPVEEEERERYPLCQVPEEPRERYPLCQLPEEEAEEYPLSQILEEQSVQYPLTIEDKRERYPLVQAVFGDPESTQTEPFDLHLPNFFRSRSHSYLRAIQAGCSQDDDTISLQSMSPPFPIISRTLPRHIGIK